MSSSVCHDIISFKLERGGLHLPLVLASSSVEVIVVAGVSCKDGAHGGKPSFDFINGELSVLTLVGGDFGVNPAGGFSCSSFLAGAYTQKEGINFIRSKDVISSYVVL